MKRLLLGLPLCLALACTTAPETTPNSEPPGGLPPVRESVDATKLQSKDAIEHLARTNPIGFLQHCLDRYDREIRTYRVLLVKRERVAGKLGIEEHVRCQFRESPFSVRMTWEKGIGKATRTLYVAGENEGQLLAVPSGFIASRTGIWTRKPDSEDARASSRYPITRFGIKCGMEQTLAAWQVAQKRGDLKVIFHGEEVCKEANNRVCWKLQRVGYPAPEDGGVLESTNWYDKETGLQIASFLTGEGGELIAYYRWQNLELNPEFPQETFTREGLRKK